MPEVNARGHRHLGFKIFHSVKLQLCDSAVHFSSQAHRLGTRGEPPRRAQRRSTCPSHATLPCKFKGKRWAKLYPTILGSYPENHTLTSPPRKDKLYETLKRSLLISQCPAEPAVPWWRGPGSTEGTHRGQYSCRHEGGSVSLEGSSTTSFL